MTNHRNTIRKKRPADTGMSVGQWLLRVIQGAIIGGGSILPGISGGVFCVTFGIYQPMMALIAHPIRAFKSSYKLFIPIILGCAAGFLGLAKAVEIFFEASSALAVSLFIGLIAGTLPSLFKDAGKNGVAKGSWSGFTISLFIVFAVLLFLKNGTTAGIEPNIWWYFFCGGVWGLSLVVPGLSSSSILIFMGLYQKMTEGIAALDPGVILPLFAGIAITTALLARFVNRLFERHYSLSSHTILGIVIASTLMIVPTEFSDAGDAIFSAACFTIGFILALIMSRFNERVRERNK